MATPTKEMLDEMSKLITSGKLIIPPGNDKLYEAFNNLYNTKYSGEEFDPSIDKLAEETKKQTEEEREQEELINNATF